MKSIELDVRYYHLTYRAYINEDEFHLNTLHWELPVNQIALILVDVWSDHYAKTHLDRGRDITLNRILPVLEAFRELGAAVIHAPSPSCATKYPQWTQFAGNDEVFGRPSQPRDNWPPPEFRSKTGEYAKWARPKDPKDAFFDSIIENRSIIPEVAPQDGDHVILNGDQLHRLLKHKQILQLFYVGFAANMCVPFRDYGMRAMHDRGYDVTLLRDCTSAIEVAETYPDMLLSKAAVVEIEQTVGYSAASEDLVAACRNAR